MQPTEASASTFHFPSPANSEEPGGNLPTTQRVQRTPVPGTKAPLPQKPGPGSLHWAVGLKGLRMRLSCLGTGRPAFFLWAIQQATRLPEGAMDGEHRLSCLQLCLLTTAKGRSPQRPRVTLPWERGLRRVGVPGWGTLAQLLVVWACSKEGIPRVASLR